MSSSAYTLDSEASGSPAKKCHLSRQNVPEMATTQSVEPAGRVVIDPDGDLVLVLPNLELQVSSKILCMTSKVFKAMLSTSFAEGNTNLVGGIRRVDLPDDDTDAMHILCGILHYRSTTDYPGPATLEKVALVTDKYDCVAAMSHWSHIALQAHIPKTGYHEISRLLYPAYEFDNPDAFKKLTRAMVYNVEGSADPLSGPLSSCVPSEIRDLLPHDIFVTLIMRQNDIKFDLQFDLEKVVEPVARKTLEIMHRNLPANEVNNFSQCDSHRIGVFINALCSESLWPMAPAFRCLSIKMVCEQLGHCDFGGFEKLSIYNKRCLKCYPDLAKAVASAVKKAEKAFAGLCLDCVRHHKKNEAERAECRIPHTDFRGLRQDRGGTSA